MVTRETLQGPQKRRGHVQTPQQIPLGRAGREDTGPGSLVSKACSVDAGVPPEWAVWTATVRHQQKFFFRRL